MKKYTKSTFTTLFLGVFLLFLSGCNNTNETPPFPVLDNQYTQPTTKSF
jgi:hypothetical protein